MKTCSEPECDQPARSKGLCRQHYDASRRGEPKKKGPAPKYSDDIRERYGGAPSISVRFSPETWEAVREHGGAPWVRKIIEAYVKVAKDPARARHWEDLEKREGGGENPRP